MVVGVQVRVSMTLDFDIAEDSDSLKPRIVVFGVGGAGGNAVNNMIRKKLEGVDFIVANTDAQALRQSEALSVLQLGAGLTQGLGAGADPSVGESAANETLDVITDKLEGAHMCFITAGMGGGTGTGAAPVIARAAKDLGILTVGVVTKPFQFEGMRRMRLADSGVQQLQSCVDTLIVIPNQNLFRIANEKTTFVDAFMLADDVLFQGVRGVTDLMVKPGLVNLDFADVRSIMVGMGKAMMGTGEASGDGRSIEAAKQAIANPLLDEISLKGARGVIVSICGGYDLTLFEVDEAADYVRKQVDQEANIIVGATFDSTIEGSMSVSVVATGIDDIPTSDNGGDHISGSTKHPRETQDFDGRRRGDVSSSLEARARSARVTTGDVRGGSARFSSAMDGTSSPRHSKGSSGVGGIVSDSGNWLRKPASASRPLNKGSSGVDNNKDRGTYGGDTGAFSQVRSDRSSNSRDVRQRNTRPSLTDEEPSDGGGKRTSSGKSVSSSMVMDNDAFGSGGFEIDGGSVVGGINGMSEPSSPSLNEWHEHDVIANDKRSDDEHFSCDNLVEGDDRWSVSNSNVQSRHSSNDVGIHVLDNNISSDSNGSFGGYSNSYVSPKEEGISSNDIAPSSKDLRHSKSGQQSVPSASGNHNVSVSNGGEKKSFFGLGDIVKKLREVSGKLSSISQHEDASQRASGMPRATTVARASSSTEKKSSPSSPVQNSLAAFAEEACSDTSNLHANSAENADDDINDDDIYQDIPAFLRRQAN